MFYCRFSWPVPQIPTFFQDVAGWIVRQVDVLQVLKLRSRADCFYLECRAFRHPIAIDNTEDKYKIRIGLVSFAT